MTIVLLLAVSFLAYSNGANDNFKGVASLFGSGTASYRTAIGWATATTMAGSFAAIVLAQSLLLKFSGKGLVPDALVGSEYFVLAVALGAGMTVILATLTGFPVSTTHALIGAMAGSGWMAVGSQVQLSVLGRTFFLPLLLSPLLAVALGALLYLSLRWLRLRLGITKEWCVCIGTEQQIIAMPQPSSVLALQSAAPSISTGMQSECSQRYVGHFRGVGTQQLMDAAHFLSAGVVGFARGLNDTPKIAALLLILPARGRDDESQDYRHESRAGFFGQPCDRITGYGCKSGWAAGVDDARVSRFAGRHRLDKRAGRLSSSPQHSVFVGHHTAVCCRHWRHGL
jgi:inorganic phosphate transporter, PiT family